MICTNTEFLPHRRLCALLTNASLFRIRIRLYFLCSDKRHKTTARSQIPLPEVLIKSIFLYCALLSEKTALSFSYFRCSIPNHNSLLIPLHSLIQYILRRRISAFPWQACYAESTYITHNATATTSAIRDPEHIAQHGGSVGIAVCAAVLAMGP
jgi:hypothetical protein